MIICVKQPKLNKVDNNLFKIVAISNDKDFDSDSNNGIFNMTELCPPADLFISYNNGELSKKKFLKKYRKYIEQKNTTIEYTIFTLGMALANKSNICLTANEKEYRIGYVKVLADYLGELFGVEVKDLDNVNNDIKMELESFSKKERKIIKKDSEELSKKQKKFKEKIIKTISKTIRDDMSEDGRETFEKMDRKFAIEQLAMVLIKNECVKIDKKTNSFKDIDSEKIGNIKPYIEAVFIASEESKPIKKIVKSVFESHGVKCKKKACKKLDTVAYITLFGEIYGNVLGLREGNFNK